MATPYVDNLRYFDVTIDGPPDTPYEGGQFKLELFLPEDYPMSAPKVRFLTRLYHVNVDRLGRYVEVAVVCEPRTLTSSALPHSICLDILKDKWSPALQIRTVLLSIQALMSSPNPDDPLDAKVAEAWLADEDKALATAREWTEKYAKPKAAADATATSTVAAASATG